MTICLLELYTLFCCTWLFQPKGQPSAAAQCEDGCPEEGILPEADGEEANEGI